MENRKKRKKEIEETAGEMMDGKMSNIHLSHSAKETLLVVVVMELLPSLK